MSHEPVTLEQQWESYRKDHKKVIDENQYFLAILRGVFVVSVFVLIGMFLLTEEQLPDYWANVYITVVGAVSTIFILDKRTEERLKQQRKQELILQLGSQSNDFALEAKRQLEQLGWLDYALAKGNFKRANWQGMILSEIDLVKPNLWKVNLTNSVINSVTMTKPHMFSILLVNAELNGVTLTEAELWGAKLMGAKLYDIDLIGATLQGADLTNARLWEVNLTKSDLKDVVLKNSDLSGATLTNAQYSEDTILPNGDPWTPDTDMTRFTDRMHPDFWRSDDPQSPAYDDGQVVYDDWD